MGDLVDGKIGSVGSYSVAFSAGQLVISETASLGAGVSEEAKISISAAAALTAIKAAVPAGSFEASILDAAIALVGKL